MLISEAARKLTNQKALQQPSLLAINQKNIGPVVMLPNMNFLFEKTLPHNTT